VLRIRIGKEHIRVHKLPASFAMLSSTSVILVILVVSPRIIPAAAADHRGAVHPVELPEGPRVVGIRGSEVVDVEVEDWAVDVDPKRAVQIGDDAPDIVVEDLRVAEATSQRSSSR